jgi:opacity protein-like surface antigen
MISKLPAAGAFIFAAIVLILEGSATAQVGVLKGEVADPMGSVVPGAKVAVSRGRQVVETQTGADGHYAFHTLAPGSYTVKATAKGFEPLTIQGIALAAGRVKELNLPLSVAIERDEVTVNGRANGVDVSPTQNSSAMVFRGRDLDALSDDPDQLQSELQELAGAAAGPNGGQIYIDGFAGGQLPPKSSILEIRVNQNPFSAEFDRVGYGRVEIITKPGTQALHGSISGYGGTSATNSSNPLLQAQDQPQYYLYSYTGDISGPMGKNASFFLSASVVQKQNQSVVDAVNPQNTTASLREAVPNPISILAVSPRFDFQLGKNTISIRDYFYRGVQSGGGVGVLNLADQALSDNNKENTLQFSDAIVFNNNFLNEIRAQWIRIRENQISSLTTPSITVQGAFIGGGNNDGVVQDHQDNFELQDYSTVSAGNHTLRFGTRLREYRDTNYSTAGSNGAYTFSSIAAYNAKTPTQYAAAIINNPVARATLLDGALFFQDDWRVKPNLMIGIGARFESQNWIHDRADWAPRIALAWSPGRPSNSNAKAVIRVGYGWFYDRFSVANSLGSIGDAPWVIRAQHDNLINQQSYVVNNPTFYDPTAPAPASTLIAASTSVPSFHSVDPHFHAALDMQAGAGIDLQPAKNITFSVTYLYTQGVHQYFSNNVTAPAFNGSTYTVTGPPPPVFNYQFQSGGFYKQHQLIVTNSWQLRRFVLNGSYTFNQAMSDTQGVDQFVSVAQNPGLDYGRASFGVRHRMNLLTSYTAPWGIVLASLLEAQSGTPYNLTTGADLTGNNQFNARPAYGICGAAGLISTSYGCLDPNPAGKGETMIPFGLGTGPANVLFDLRASKTFGVGPREKVASEGQTMDSSAVSDQGLNTGGAKIRLDAGAPRRYSLTFVVGASNLLNIVNLGTPNGVLNSPIFNKSQSLAGGSFANPTPGNRALIFQANFSF